MTPFAWFAVIAGGVGLLTWFGWQQEKKRTEALRNVAMAMGFAFADQDDAVVAPDMPFLQEGRYRKAKNVMRGQTAGRNVTVFEHVYTTGGGKSSQTHRETAAMFEGVTGLPDFDLTPENFLTRIANVFGYQDIDFDENPGFSGAYLLRGKDEAAVRAAFGQDVLAFFATNQGWSVHTWNGRLAVCRADRRPKPEETPAFLADCLRIATALDRR